ncbi:MAG: rhodanese-like domain-containing protein [Kiritimatiellae bacterium]|nr:rhodanese-like domain-containing protein [Kiritimatiellia bacterium]MDW8457602.1 rhodanese-like domain-containing protein [Verrucomicrobiota bacterium]
MAICRLPLWQQMVWLAAATLGLGTAAQVFSPTRIPWRENWSDRVQTRALHAGLMLADTEQMRALLAEGSTIVFDARSLRDYEAGHIPGALPFPEARRFEYYPDYANLLPPDQRIVVYCSGRTCDESLRLGLFLREHGHTNLVLYLGGFSEWQAAGLDVAR